MQRKLNLKEINYKYPEFAIGFHSGWSEDNHPTSKLIITARKKVPLIKYNFTILFNKTNLNIPFYLKSRNGKIFGLTSGAGSTIIKFKNNYYKIKRNGYKLFGFYGEIPDREFYIKTGLYEAESPEIGGGLNIKDARREIQIEKKLFDKGYNLPQKTVALYEINKQSKQVALIQKVNSEFRADELCTILLINLFYKIFKLEFSLNIINSKFRYPKYSLSHAINIFEKEYKHTIIQIGANIGGLYKALHDDGYIRGIDNSWFGNEIICDDGDIGLCDLESTFTEKEINNQKSFDYLKKMDCQLAKTAFYDSMNFFNNSIASLIGITLVEGFDKGYSEKYHVKLDNFIIKKEIREFMNIKSKVIIYD